jgi:hypothetical protein
VIASTSYDRVEDLMGTWGPGQFDDDAVDWLDALADVADDSLLHGALDTGAARCHARIGDLRGRLE